MSRIWYILIGAALLVVGGAYFVSQNPVARNIQYILTYKKTLDTYAQTDTTETDVIRRADVAGRAASLVSAFYGLDSEIPHMFGLVGCKGAGGSDGMPLIFSHEVDITTLEPGDLKITTASGAIGEVICLTLAPADDQGELRTALLLGQYGSIDDQPVKVEIVGNVLSLDGTLNFKGAEVTVTPLEVGPSLVWAEIVPEAEWNLGAVATKLPWGGGNGCPVGTKQVVRVTWDGGVTKPDGRHADAVEGKLYRVTVSGAGQTTETITPIALADLGDGDNNHELCLDVETPAVSSTFPAGHLTDPRDDLNDATFIEVQPSAGGT